MIENLTKLYDGSDLSGANPNLIYLPILKNGTLKSVDVLTDLAVSGDVVFALKLNGVAVVGADAITIADTTKIGTISGLNIAVFFGDEFTLDMISGSVSVPLTLNLSVDDGKTINDILPSQTGNAGKALQTDGAAVSWQTPSGGGGTSLPEGDLNATTNKLEKISTRPLKDLSLAGAFEQLVTWTPSTVYTVNGNAITKTVNNNSWGNSIISSTGITGDGDFIWVYNSIGTANTAFGVTTTPLVKNSPLNFNFSFLSAYGNVADIYESGSSKPFTATPVVNGDELKITRRGTVIEYYFKGVLRYTSVVNSTGTLYLAVGMYDTGVTESGFTEKNIPVDFLTDKSLLWFNTTNNRFEDVTLAQLKSAINALP